MRITSKGQVTIPIEIRERLGLLPHTQVRFEVEGDTVRILRVEKLPAGRGQKLLERMRGRATSGMSTDQIMALTRGITPRRATPEGSARGRPESR